MLGSLAPARRRLLLALAAVVVAAGLAIGIAVAVSGDGTTRAVAQDRPGPVLLVPGYGGSVTGLNTLADRLRKRGKAVTVVRLPGNAQGDLRQQAQVLAVAAKAALIARSARSVDVVGYSAGGVVARLWVRDYGGAAIARRIVTLGSPQHGTQLAGLGTLFPGSCPAACQQLAPGSDLLTALNRGGETPAGPSFVSIWTTRDEVVIPPDSARLTGALNITVQSVCAESTVTHSELPSDRIVDAMVATELAAGPPVALSAADCSRLR